MTFNFLGPGLTVNVEAKVKEQIILDSSGLFMNKTIANLFEFCGKDVEKEIMKRRELDLST